MIEVRVFKTHSDVGVVSGYFVHMLHPMIDCQLTYDTSVALLDSVTRPQVSPLGLSVLICY